MRQGIRILDLRPHRISIFQQLIIEEALLRCDKRNWCILNTGHAETAIVMGISGRAERLVNVDAAIAARVPVIKRFTGGGTVIVDSNTLFVSFICNQADVVGRPLYPRELMHWSTGLYSKPLAKLVPQLPFGLHEHDYCLGDKKVGGNAQSVSRDRWVHHTSWLWSFLPERMGLLQLPEKRPAYRRDRPHADFLTTLSEHAAVSNGDAFLDGIAQHISDSWHEEPEVVEAAAGGNAAGASHGPTPRAQWATIDDVQQALVENERRSNVYVDLEAVSRQLKDGTLK